MDPREFLRRVAAVVHDAAEHADEVRRSHDNTPASGSRSEMLIEVLDRDFGGEEMLRRPGTDLVGVGSLLLMAAEDHLIALGRLINPEPPRSFSLASAARSAVELSSRSWYLLDPDVTVAASVSRWATEILYSWWESDRGGFPLTNGRTVSECYEITQAWAEAHNLEFTATKGHRKPPYVGIDPRPPATLLAGRLTADNPHLGAGAYRVFSGPAHGNVGALLEYTQALSPDPDAVGAEVTMTTRRILIPVAAALFGYLPAFDRHRAVNGWNDLDTTGSDADVRRRLRQLWELVEPESDGS